MKIPNYIQCLDGYRELDDLERFKICNGCGSARAKIDLIPDHLLGLGINHACWPHDFRYAKGMTEDDKRKADLEFLCNMMEIINHESVWFLKFHRRRIALDYYSAVCDFGSSAFWAGKQKPVSNYLHA